MDLIALPKGRVLLLQFLSLSLVLSACDQRILRYRDFSGDGTFSDRGCCAKRPRYRIEFEPIPIRPGRTTHEFRVRAAPEAEYYLMLVAQPGTPLPLKRADLRVLVRQFELVASVHIADSTGIELRREGALYDHWHDTQSHLEQVFYQIGDEGLFQKLTPPLTVRVVLSSGSSGRDGLLSLQPVLLGGGWESM